MTNMDNKRRLDDLDVRIIKLLQTDGRLSGDAIAKRLGESSPTVRRRIRELTKNGVLHIVAIPRPRDVGLNVNAMVGITVKPEKLDEIVEELSSREEISYVGYTAGRYDILANLWAGSLESLGDYVKTRIASLDGIKGCESLICFQISKIWWIKQ